MSIFGKFLGGGKKEKAITPQDGIQKLLDVEEMLIKKTEFLEKKIEVQLALAKQYGSKNKRAAIQALKRKKRIEKQLSQIDGTLSTIEFQREALENSTANTQVFKVMTFAATALKKANDNLDADKIHDMMDDIEEQRSVSEEINNAISRPVGEDLDEDDLMAELEELEQDDLNERLLDTRVTDHLPSVPTEELEEKASAKRQAKEEDNDMKMLESWLS